MKQETHVPLNAYQTKLLKTQQGRISGISDTIHKAILLEQNDGLVKEGLVYSVTGDVAGETIPRFTLPVVDSENIYVDARAFVTRSGELKLGSEHPFLKELGMVEFEWQRNPSMFNNTLSQLVDIWSRWVANALDQSLNIHVLQSESIRAVCAIYWMGNILQLWQDPIAMEDSKTLLLKRLPRILSAPATLLSSNLLEPLESEVHALLTDPDNRIDRLVSVIGLVTEDAYAIDLNTLYTACTQGAYVGANSAEVAGVALEHVPTFAVIVSVTGRRGIQGKTKIGRIAESVVRRSGLNELELSIKRAHVTAG